MEDSWSETQLSNAAEGNKQDSITASIILRSPWEKYPHNAANCQRNYDSPLWMTFCAFNASFLAAFPYVCTCFLGTFTRKSKRNLNEWGKWISENVASCHSAVMFPSLPEDRWAIIVNMLRAPQENDVGVFIHLLGKCINLKLIFKCQDSMCVGGCAYTTSIQGK